MFQCSLQKHVQTCTNGCTLEGIKSSFKIFTFLLDLTIQYGKNEARHLLVLKEIHSKTEPADHEEAVALKDLDEAFAQASHDVNSEIHDLVRELETEI